MPKYNDKTEVGAQSLIQLAERLELSAEKLRSIAKLMASNDISALSLAMDTFRSVAIARSESFARTVEREYFNKLNESAARIDVAEAEKLLSDKRKKSKKP